MSYRFNDGYINPGPDGYIRISSDGYSLLTSDGYNIAFFSQSGKVFDAAKGIMYITNRTTAPSSTPSGGGWLYAEQGDGYWYNPVGVIQSISSTRTVSVMPSDANYTAVQSDYQAKIIEVTSSVSLTAPRSFFLPSFGGPQWTVFNNTTGAQNLVFVVSGMSGVTVAPGKRAIVYCNGTDIVRVTPDT